MHARRVRGAAGVLLTGVCAGAIASRNGNATDTPSPRRTVRRERYFFVISIPVPSPDYPNLAASLVHRCSFHLLRPSHLERSAAHDAENERRKTIVVFGGILLNRAHGRHIAIIHHSTQSVCQQIL